MLVEFDKSFSKSLDKIKDHKIQKRIFKFIEFADNAKIIQEIPSIKKMTGFKTFYRYRFGNYRIGFRIINTKTIRLIVVAKREVIYTIFP